MRENRIRYSFQPGPAQLHPSVPSAIQEALEAGLLSRYHRDEVWKALYAQAQSALLTHLDAPADWLVAFVSSATEGWHLWVQVTSDLTALHVVQGSFGENWFALRAAISPFAKKYVWDFSLPPEPQIEALQSRYQGVASLAIVHVETSKGAWLPDISLWRKAFPDALIGLDAASSLGAIPIPWDEVDFVLASIQKGLGLPPGLGVVFLSPRCVVAFQDYPAQAYNALSRLIEMARQHEPLYTPNLLGIYLLAKTLAQRPSVSQVFPTLTQRARALYEKISAKGYQPLLPESYRSPSVLAFMAPSERALQALHQKAEANGLYLGRGYGELKNQSFRIANFPALTQEAYEALLSILGEIG